MLKPTKPTAGPAVADVGHNSPPYYTWNWKRDDVLKFQKNKKYKNIKVDIHVQEGKQQQ